MVTVTEATEKILNRSRYLSEALSKGLINTSSLARYIKPEIEEMLIKKVSISAVIMSLKRLEKKLSPPSSFKNLFKTQPEMEVYLKDKAASISIHLSNDHEKTPGVYYFFLKSLAWERININSIHSEGNKLVIWVDEKDINRAFFVLKSLFNPVV